MKVLSVDIGGTFIRFAVISDNADLKKIAKVTSSPYDNFEKVSSSIKKVFDEENKIEHLDGLAISMYGVVSDGICKGWNDKVWFDKMNVKEKFESLLKTKVFVINDGKAGLLGSIWKGYVSADKDIVSVLIGTGVGGAMWINNKLFLGADGATGEFGGVKMLQSNLYVQELISTGSITKKYREMTGNESASVTDLFNDVHGKNENKNFDSFILYGEWLMNLADYIFGIISSLNPDTILLTGEVIGVESFVKDLNKNLATLLDESNIKYETNIVTVDVGNKINMIGAAKNFFDKTK